MLEQPRTPVRRCAPSRAVSRWARALLLAGAVPGWLAGPAAAQTLTGRVVARESGAPLRAALVVLLDSAGADRAAVLSDTLGRFWLSAPGPGAWSVRAEQIGRQDVTVPAPVERGVPPAALVLAAPISPLLLQPIVVAGHARCRISPAAGELTAQLWEEARKALRVSRQARRSNWFTLLEFSRVIDARTGFVLSNTEHTRGGLGGRPFGSATEAELDSLGYVQRLSGAWAFWAPDEDVLLSEGFLRHHCIEARSGGHGARRDEVGVAFKPLRGNAHDIEGVVWLDRSTAELRSVEFRYTGLRWNVPDRALSGAMEFTRLPSGATAIRTWYIRMPILTTTGNMRRIIESGAQLVDDAPAGSGP
jgi:hypothetical protein